MKRTSIQWLGRLTVLAVSTACALSCSSPTRLPVAEATRAMHSMNASVWQITQVEFGQNAAFARCAPPACPSVTTKTLALEHRAGTAAAPPVNAAASLATGEYLSPAMGKGQRTPPDAAKPNSAPPNDTLTGRVVVHFAFGDATLSPDGRALIDEAAGPLASARRIAISGRTDSVGPPHINQWLATARANAVRDHLRSRYPHLAPALSLEAQGACCFAASNETPQGRAMNRRVEVVIERDAEAL